MLHHGRIGAFATAAALALALLAPSTSMAAHDLVIYKAEQQVDLDSDNQDVTVSCQPGDHALDGMWRVDHADQDDYVAYLDLLKDAVDVQKAAASGPNDSAYSFNFEKIAIGRVQVKVFVTCLGDKTSGGPHTHSFTAGAFDSSVPATYHTVPLVVPGGTTQTIDSSSYTCPGKRIVVSPGYAVTAVTNNNDSPVSTEPEPGMTRLLESDLTSSAMNTWRWTFQNPPGLDSTITLTWRCLALKVPTGGFDKHKLTTKYRTNGSPAPQLAKKRVSEVQLNCGDHYKAIVAGFRIDPLDYAHVWFLGMDPRIKSRAFRFLNDDTVTHPVTFNGICLNYRTT